MIKPHFKEAPSQVTFGNDIALNLANLTCKISAKNLPFLPETEWQCSFSSAMTLPTQSTVNVDKL